MVINHLYFLEQCVLYSSYFLSLTSRLSETWGTNHDAQRSRRIVLITSANINFNHKGNRYALWEGNNTPQEKIALLSITKIDG